MPIHSAGMLKSPVDRNPARQPRLQPQIFRTRGVPANFKHVKILPGENIPVAVQKRASQMLRQRFEGAAIFRVVRVDGIVVEPGADKFVIARAAPEPPTAPSPRRDRCCRGWMRLPYTENFPVPGSDCAKSGIATASE